MSQKTGLWRMDMHMHTSCSHDCLTPPSVLLAAAQARGLDKIVVTDHNQINGAQLLRRLDPQRVIVGEEIKTAEGFDVIGIFLEELIPKGTPAKESCERIRDQGGVVYLPHPFDSSRSGGAVLLDQLADFVDVIEVHNARCFPTDLNRQARDWAERNDKLMGAGSDAHTVAELGRGYVEVPPFTHDRDSFLAALAAGKVAGTHNTSPVFRLASTWAKVRKYIPVPVSQS